MTNTSRRSPALRCTGWRLGFTALLLATCASCRPSASPTVGADHDVWDVLRVQGSKVGYQHTTSKLVDRDGHLLRQIDTEVNMALDRDGQPITMTMGHESLETPDGQLLSYSTQMQGGGTLPIVMRGQVAQGRLVIETETAGKLARQSVPWPADARGFQAVEQSLAAQPMKAGERRQLLTLVPEFNQAAQVELIAAREEPTQLLDRTENLLRIENRTSVDGKALPLSTHWMDSQGQIVKTKSDMLAMESFRTSQDVAKSKTTAPNTRQFDLWNATFVQPDRALSRPHATRRVRYQVHLDGQDPAKVFPSGLSQHVKSIDGETAEITVEAIRPSLPPAAAGETPPTDDDRQPNSLIQSDDARVIALANQVAPDETDPWKVAVALEELVHRRMKLQDLSQGFATAAEVAQNLSGDCTEYGVLLAGLARARGIPSRVAMGLVYTSQGFGFHMWTEVWIADRWVPLDGTLGRGGIGAAHLKIEQSNLKGAAAFTGFIPVAQVLGRLKIKIIEQE